MNHATLEALVSDLEDKRMCKCARDWVVLQTSVASAWKKVPLKWRLRAMLAGFADGRFDCPWDQVSRKELLQLIMCDRSYLDQIGWTNLTGREKAILEVCHGSTIGDCTDIVSRDRRRASRFLACQNQLAFHENE